MADPPGVAAEPRCPSLFRAERRTVEGLKSGTNMKTTINIEIECTPAEARSFLGLPDVEPIQAAVMERLQERMLSEIDNFSPESLEFRVCGARLRQRSLFDRDVYGSWRAV